MPQRQIFLTAYNFVGCPFKAAFTISQCPPRLMVVVSISKRSKKSGPPSFGRESGEVPVLPFGTKYALVYNCHFVYVCMYECMVTHKAREWIIRVRLPIQLVVSWKGKINISLSPFAPENLVSRDGFRSPVPRQPAHLHTQAEFGAYLRNSSRVPRRRPFIYLNRYNTPSGHAIATDGVHCREAAGTGPVDIKVVPNGCCLGRSPWNN